MKKQRKGVSRKIMKYYVRKRRKTSSEEEDRLSSLPDAILSDILSRLKIHSAAATSVLSHRWRHLWTTITCLRIGDGDIFKSNTTMDHILRQVLSPKIVAFDLDYSSSLYLTPRFRESEPWFREICRRNVENFTLDAGTENAFRIPACLMNSQSLVTLNLTGLLNSKLPKNSDLSLCSSFHLPNLKELALHHLNDVPIWLETLIRSCPLLEDLHLAFNLDLYLEDLPPPIAALNIIASNLKSLFVRNFTVTRGTIVSIDAPKLTDLVIYDCCSIYYLLQNPTILVKAHIELYNDEGYGLESEDEEEDYDSLSEPRKEYLLKMTKFVGGLSNVSKLVLNLDSRSNLLRHSKSLNLPVFSNVVRLETNCFKELLMFSSSNFPNLEHLEMCLYFHDHISEQRNWYKTLDSIPNCLLSKLKTIQIWGLKGIVDDLKHLAYILSNAVVLNKLFVGFRGGDWRVYIQKERDKAYDLWRECKFCQSLFKLPKSCSSCEVLVTGRYVRASSDALQGGHLTFQMRNDLGSG